MTHPFVKKLTTAKTSGDDSLKMVTEILVYFYDILLLIPPSNTELKLLVLLFVIKLYAQQFLFSKFEIMQ